MQIFENIKIVKFNLVSLELKQKNRKMPKKILTKYYISSFTIYNKNLFDYSLSVTSMISFNCQFSFNKTQKLII